MKNVRILPVLLLACLLVFTTGFTGSSIPLVHSATPTSVWKISSDSELSAPHYAIETDRYIFVADEVALDFGANYFGSANNQQSFRDIAMAASLAAASGEEVVFTGVLTERTYRMKQVVVLHSATIGGKVMYVQSQFNMHFGPSVERWH